MAKWRIAAGGVTWGSEAAYYWLEPPEFEPMLDQIVEAGYTAIERSSNFPEDPVLVRRLLEQRGLDFVGAWRWIDVLDPANHESELSRTTEFGRQVKEIGGGVIILSEKIRPHRNEVAGRVTEADALSENEFQALTGWLNRAGEALLELELRTVYHPHAGTSIERRFEFERLLAATDPSLVGLCLDTGHVAYAGDDPVAALVDHSDRIAHVHFKDVDVPALAQAKAEGVDFLEMIRRGVFAALGKGTVDLTQVLGALESVSYDGWIVIEQDAAGNPLEDAITSRWFLESFASGN